MLELLDVPAAGKGWNCQEKSFARTATFMKELQSELAI